MNFATPEFIALFLPLSLGAFALVQAYGGFTARRLCLLVISAAFYAAGGLTFFVILAGSIVINHALGVNISRSGSRSLFLAAVFANLGLLAYFKYAGFFLGAIASDAFGFASLALPLGISFYTFQQIAWLVDIRRGLAEPGNLLDHALFVSFFPQLVAGPIVHHGQLVPQLRRPSGVPDLGDARLTVALIYLFGGLAKKVLIADPIGDMINPLWVDVSALSFYDAWVAALGYGLQLYFDFSAYGEMAIGLGLLFGVQLPKNFDSPYKAASLQQFWRRWHITLGAFLRDYLYIPLGGSRSGLLRTLSALMLTMALGGLWHGAGWTFIAWGVAHGLALCVEVLGRRCGVILPRLAGHALTLSFVLLAWVPFRAASLDDAITVYETMFGFAGIALPDRLAAQLSLPVAQTALAGYEIILLLCILGVALFAPNMHQIADRPPRLRRLAPVGFLLLAAVSFELGVSTDFLYWQW